jgi:pimeloyl-ACP methyl ester carboxylesterase/DNA-binding CsgD family transcriptional regulator
LRLEKKQQIVALARETVSDPAKVERFVNELSSIYDRSLAARKGASGKLSEHEQVLDLVDAERYFEQAANAFARLWDQDNFQAPSIYGNGETVFLNSQATVVSVLSENEAKLPFVPGQSVFEAPTDADAEALLKDGLKQISGPQSETTFCIVPFYQEDGRRTLWALSPAAADENGAMAQLNRVDFSWSKAAGEAITEAFGLSNSEQEILKTLVRGESLTELAQKRQRSIETVRTQAKSLRTKTGVNSQLDLIRLFAAITLVVPELATPVCGNPEAPALPGSLSLTLPDNRQMQVDIHGPPTGRPVLFLHNMFSGTMMPPPVLDALNRYGIRLICPWRPGFARSSPQAEKPLSPERSVAADLTFLLDTLGIGRTTVVGHMSSAVYAAAATALLPDRIRGAAAIAGFPPFLERKHIDHLPAWPRLYAYTSRYLPKALSLLVRGTFGLLAENRIEILFDNLYAGAELDTKVISVPENRELFLNDFRRALEQGTASYEIDAALAASDWSHWLDNRAPGSMTFIHGTEDPVTPITLVREIAELRPEMDLLPIDNAGHLALYQVPEKIIARIADLAG